MGDAPKRLSWPWREEAKGSVRNQNRGRLDTTNSTWGRRRRRAVHISTADPERGGVGVSIIEVLKAKEPVNCKGRFFVDQSERLGGPVNISEVLG
jgi:hypothetical protein